MITIITTVFNRLFKHLDVPSTEEETLEVLRYKKFLDRHAELTMKQYEDLDSTGTKPSAFTKAEMANKPLSQQRNITAVVTSMILACSRFTKVATRLFKHKVKTYGFCKDNKQISSLIYNLISRCESFILGDFSKFDRTQNEFTRSIDIEFFKSIFTKDVS